MSTMIRKGELRKSLVRGKISSSLQKTIREKTGAKNISQVRTALARGMGGKNIKGRSAYLKKLKIRAGDIKSLEETITPKEKDTFQEKSDRQPTKTEIKQQKKEQEIKTKRLVASQAPRGDSRRIEGTSEFVGGAVTTKSRVGGAVGVDSGTDTMRDSSRQSISARDKKDVTRNGGIVGGRPIVTASINATKNQGILNKKENEDSENGIEKIRPPMGF